MHTYIQIINFCAVSTSVCPIVIVKPFLRQGLFFYGNMVLIPCVLINHLASLLDIGTPLPANFPSIIQLKLVGLPVIRQYNHR